MLTKIAKARPTVPARNLLLWAGGAAALLAALVFRRNLGAEYHLLQMLGIVAGGPAAPPVAAGDWFGLLADNRLLGLVLLNFFDVVNYLLLGVVLLALFAALRRQGEALMFLAMALGFTGIAVFLASNQALTVAALCDQYALAPGEAQRQLILAGAQGVLAVNFRESFSGAGLYLSFLFVSVAGLLASIVMLKSRIFGRAAAVLGMLANGFGLGYYLLVLAAPGLIALTLSVSAVFLLVWYVLIALKLFKLGRGEAKIAAAARRPAQRRLR